VQFVREGRNLRRNLNDGEAPCLEGGEVSLLVLDTFLEDQDGGGVALGDLYGVGQFSQIAARARQSTTNAGIIYSETTKDRVKLEQLHEFPQGYERSRRFGFRDRQARRATGAEKGPSRDPDWRNRAKVVTMPEKQIWDAPPCREFSSIFLIVGAILFAMLRVWFISIPFLAIVSFFVWQFIKACRNCF
jgi:hypothetical protein